MRALKPASLLLAAVALLALFGALALPATTQAQSVTTFVSNTGETQDRDSTSIQASSFTTGSNTDGYTLSEVDVRHISSTSTSGTMVKVMSDNGSGRPGALVANLDNPSSFPDDSIIGFTAPASTETLAANTVYWVVMNDGRAFGESTRTRVGRTDSSDETATATDPNWSIGDKRYWKNRPADNWAEASDPLVFAIKGTAVGGGTPSADATLSGLTVTAGGSDLVTFASDTETYTASVANDVAEVTVTATKNDSGASIEYLDGDDATLDDANTSDDGHQVTLVEGDNVIKVKVTAADGNTTKTYTVTVSRAAAASTCTLETGDLWCGVVTVGTYSNGVGFTDSDGTLTDNTGDQTITIGSANYMISSVVILASPAGALVMGLDTRFPTDDETTLVFHIGSSTFEVSEATFDTGVGGYIWQDSGLSWSVGDTVDLRLRRAPAATAPTITDVAVTSTPQATSDTYGPGETIEVTVTFSEAVTATTGTDFVLSVGGAKRAPLLRGSGTTTLVFGYTVQTGDSDDDGIWIGDQDRTLVGNRNGDPQNGTITSETTDVEADLTHAELGQQKRPQGGRLADRRRAGGAGRGDAASERRGRRGQRGRGRSHGNGDGVAGLGVRLHGDGVGESGAPSNGR